MSSNWTTVKLSEVAKIIGGGTPSTSESNYWNGNIPWITPKDLSSHKDMYISSGSRSITDAGLKNSSAKLVPKDTVLFTSRAPIGYVAIASQAVCTNQGFKSLVLNEGYDSRYFYYLLKHHTPEIEARATGSTFKEISGTVLGSFEISIPPEFLQKRIAEILGALDDRITLLRETNQTLEAIAQALFKSWFVDFDPVRAKAEGRLPEGIDAATAALFPEAFEESELGSVPKGWVIGRLIDFAKLKGGKMLSKEHFSVDGEFPVYGGAGEMGRSNLSNAEGFVITVGRVGAYCGQYFWHSGKAWVNNNASHVIPHNANYSVWLYQWLRSVNMDLIKKGAAQPFVSNGDIENLQIILPDALVIEEFINVCEPLFERMSSVLVSISTLTNLRDTLLPRLISGQLRIAEAELEKATA
jgi:type I restriction enzyme S subunit